VSFGWVAKVIPNEQRPFFQLVYSERCAGATTGSACWGWSTVGTPLIDYVRQVGRPVPIPDTEAGLMHARNSLVSVGWAQKSPMSWPSVGTCVACRPTNNCMLFVPPNSPGGP
jgi:hypothetical protein